MNLQVFLITSLIIVLLPGTGVIYTISTGITKGKKASVQAAVGCTVGIIPHLCFSILFSSFILKMNSEIFEFIKMVGIVYLLYLGIEMILSRESLKLDAYLNKDKNVSVIWRAILLNLLNPKLTLFFFSFLPQYISDSQNYILESIFYGLIFMLLTFIVFVGYGLTAGMMSVVINKSSKRLKRANQLFGIIFIGFALYIKFYGN